MARSSARPVLRIFVGRATGLGGTACTALATTAADLGVTGGDASLFCVESEPSEPRAALVASKLAAIIPTTRVRRAIERLRKVQAVRRPRALPDRVARGSRIAAPLRGGSPPPLPP